MRLLSIACAALFVILLFTVSILSFTEQYEYQDLTQRMKAVDTIILLDTPKKSVQSIDIAMAIFSVDDPIEVFGPSYDPTIIERGQITKFPLVKNANVKIGDNAFDNWGKLGSTLGHEIEIHFYQSLQISVFFNRVGWFFGHPNLGDIYIERTAYQYEIDSQDRFGTSYEHVSGSQFTMNVYYPDVCGDSFYGDILAFILK